MNEVTNQSPQSTAVKAVPVAKRQTQDVKGGESLPQSPSTSLQSLAENQGQIRKRATETVHQSLERVEAAVAKMNEYTQSMQRDLQFSLDDASGRVVVNVIDRASQEVIRQIPDETFLRMARNLKDDIATGSIESFRLINTRA